MHLLGFYLDCCSVGIVFKTIRNPHKTFALFDFAIVSVADAARQRTKLNRLMQKGAGAVNALDTRFSIWDLAAIHVAANVVYVLTHGFSFAVIVTVAPLG
jgi:hypothetical protein